MKKNLTLMTVFFVLTAMHGHAQLENEISEVVDGQIIECDFSGSVLVAKNGEIIYEKISGYSDESLKTPISRSTRSSVGSIGKFLTGLLIMNLVAEGKINVEDPISKYLPEWKIPNGDKIKVKHLLTHESGLGGYMGTPEHAKLRGSRASIDQLMKIIVTTPLSFDAPGSKSQYSNSGFIVLGKLIEKLEGKDYYAVLKSRILTPLGMSQSTFDIDLGDAQFVKGYTRDADGNLQPTRDITPPSADGGLFSTPSDLLKFDQGVFNHKIISEAMLKEMVTPHSGSYGYATMVKKLPNGISYGHNGGMPGYEAEYRHFYIGNDQYTVIIMANHDRKAVPLMIKLFTVFSKI